MNGKYCIHFWGALCCSCNLKLCTPSSHSCPWAGGTPCTCVTMTRGFCGSESTAENTISHTFDFIYVVLHSYCSHIKALQNMTSIGHMLLFFILSKKTFVICSKYCCFYCNYDYSYHRPQEGQRNMLFTWMGI